MNRDAVEVTDAAEAAILAHARYIAIDRKEPRSAQRWLEAAWDALDSLELMPGRCSVADESEDVPCDVRFILAGSVSLLFTVDDSRSVVWVIAVRGEGQLPKSDRLPASLDDLAGR